MDDHRRDIALFRYSLIRAAADPGLSPRARGELVRALAARDHVGPKGERVRVSRATLDRWIRAWRRGGFDALLPRPATREPRTDKDLLALAARLKREQPRRSGAHIAAIVTEQLGLDDTRVQGQHSSGMTQEQMCVFPAQSHFSAATHLHPHTPEYAPHADFLLTRVRMRCCRPMSFVVHRSLYSEAGER